MHIFSQPVIYILYIKKTNLHHFYLPCIPDFLVENRFIMCTRREEFFAILLSINTACVQEIPICKNWTSCGKEKPIFWWLHRTQVLYIPVGFHFSVPSNKLVHQTSPKRNFHNSHIFAAKIANACGLYKWIIYTSWLDCFDLLTGRSWKHLIWESASIIHCFFPQNFFIRLQESHRVQGGNK